MVQANPHPSAKHPNGGAPRHWVKETCGVGKPTPGSLKRAILWPFTTSPGTEATKGKPQSLPSLVSSLEGLPLGDLWEEVSTHLLNILIQAPKYAGEMVGGPGVQASQALRLRDCDLCEGVLEASFIGRADVISKEGAFL